MSSSSEEAAAASILAAACNIWLPSSTTAQEQPKDNNNRATTRNAETTEATNTTAASASSAMNGTSAAVPPPQPAAPNPAVCEGIQHLKLEISQDLFRTNPERVWYIQSKWRIHNGKTYSKECLGMLSKWDRSHEFNKCKKCRTAYSDIQKQQHPILFQDDKETTTTDAANSTITANASNGNAAANASNAVNVKDAAFWARQEALAAQAYAATAMSLPLQHMQHMMVAATGAVTPSHHQQQQLQELFHPAAANELFPKKSAAEKILKSSDIKNCILEEWRNAETEEDFLSNKAVYDLARFLILKGETDPIRLDVSGTFSEQTDPIPLDNVYGKYMFLCSQGANSLGEPYADMRSNNNNNERDDLEDHGLHRKCLAFGLRTKIVRLQLLCSFCASEERNAKKRRARREADKGNRLSASSRVNHRWLYPDEWRLKKTKKIKKPLLGSTTPASGPPNV